MTTTLVKAYMAKVSLRVKILRAHPAGHASKETESLIRDAISHLENNYLGLFDRSSHMSILCYLGVRLIISKIWTLLYQMLEHQRGPARTEEMADRLVAYSTDTLEITRQLYGQAQQYGWFFQCRFLKWHVMAYLLVELYCCGPSPAADRAWAVIDTLISESKSSDIEGMEGKKATLCRKLMERAQEVREQVSWP
jgi:hypothetical protein